MVAGKAGTMKAIRGTAIKALIPVIISIARKQAVLLDNDSRTFEI